MTRTLAEKSVAFHKPYQRDETGGRCECRIIPGYERWPDCPHCNTPLFIKDERGGYCSSEPPKTTGCGRWTVPAQAIIFGPCHGGAA